MIMETRKRKPLSDLTNAFGLIPTATLRKLVESKPPKSILQSNSVYSDSETKSSIGSSNVSTTRNSNTGQFSTKPRRPLTSIASSEGDEKTKNRASGRKQTTHGHQKEREAAAAIVSSTIPMKTNDEMKEITVPSHCSSPGKIEDYGNPLCGSCSPVENAVGKEKENCFPFSENVLEVGKKILNPPCFSFEKEEKVKTILNASGCSIEKTKEPGNGILNPFSCSSEKRKERGVGSSFPLENTKEIEQTIVSPSIVQVKTMERGKAVVNSSGCSVEKTKELISNRSSCSYGRRKEIGVLIGPSSFSLKKTEERGNAILNPSSSSFEITKDKGKAVLTDFGSSIDKTIEPVFDPFSSLYEKRNQEGVVIRSPSSSSLEKTKERGMTILNPSSSSVEKTKDKGKAILSASAEKTKEPIFDPFSSLYEKRNKEGVVIRSPSSSSFEKTKDIAATILSPSSSSVEKTKDKGKAILTDFGSSIEKIKEPIFDPFSNWYEKRKKEGVVIRSPSSSSFEKRKDVGKAILNPSSSSVEKTKDKGKAVVIAFGCSNEKTKELNFDPFSSLYDKRKKEGVMIRNHSCYSDGKTNDTGKAILSSSSSSIVKTNDKGQTIHNPSECSIKETEDEGKSMHKPLDYSFRTTKKMGKATLSPSSVDKIKDNNASASVLINYTSHRRTSGKRMIDAGVSSCPPLLKTRNGKLADIKPSKSWTDPHPKRTKKRCTKQKDANDYSNLQDFIEKQKAYFKEIDDFVLEEEDVEQDKLD